MGVATTRMYSRGKVTIPEAIRAAMGLKDGMQFIVLGQGDTLILKAILPPSLERFENLLSAAKKRAHQIGLRPGDVARAIRHVRKGK